MNITEQLMERIARIEQRLSTLERDRADIDYIAMMTDVDIDNDDEGGERNERA